MGLALGRNLRVCTSAAKGLKLKVRKFLGANSYVCRSYMGKTGRGSLFAPPPILNRVNDHSPNFWNNTKCRLINPVKNELGLVSKKHLERMIGNVANIIKANHWRNTTTVIKWFKLLPENDKSRFTKFYIVEFYQSISEELLNRSNSFARSITTISDSVINIIHHSRKSISLFR